MRYLRLRTSASLAVALAGLLLAAPALAQGTRADYERAARLGERFRGKVFRDRVNPQWLDGDRFWYRIDLPGGGRETWLVDARTGERSAYEPVANAKEGGLTAYAPEGIRPGEAGGETEVTFVNRTAAPVRLFWLEGGGARREYGVIAPGAERRQHTFAGHAWLVTTEDGKPLCAFVAEEPAQKAIITGPSTTRQPGRAGGRGRGDRPAFRTGGGRAPDGSFQAFVRDNNVFIRDLKTNEEAQLTREGTADDGYSERSLYWSPDSRKLVALRTKAGGDRKLVIVESSPSDQLQPKVQSFNYLKPGDPIPQSKPHLFDIAARKEIPVADTLFPNPWSLDEMRWEPDSSRFTFRYNQRGHQVLRVVGVDAATGEARALVDEQSPTFIDYAHKTFSRYLPETGEVIWMSERDGWCHLYLIDLRAGTVKNQITKGEWVVRGVERVDPEKRQIWFRAGGIHPGQDPYYIHYARINFDGSGLVKLTEGDGTHSITYSPDGRYLVDTYSRVDMPPVTELRRVEDGKLVRVLEKADASALTSAGWRAPQRFVAKGRDGKTDIYGVLFRPTNFDPAKKYPVIEDIYAGPQGSFVPKSFQALHSPQTLAELGFIVVKIDGMGTSNRSKAFHDVAAKNLVDAGLPDRILWIRAAAAKEPAMDLDRVGIYGTSAGGQNSLGALLTHPEFYKVGVSACGCHDNRMDKIWWNELWMGWPVGPHYAEQSNTTLAPKLQGKLLLIVGELDNNVDPASTMQVADALIKANKDFDLLVVPGAGHGMGGAYGVRRMQDFFVRHLWNAQPRR